MLKPESPSPGWGRAAAMRFAKSEEEIKADIIKALEGKLSVEFQDYTQWQRVSTEGSVTSRPSTKTTFKPKSLSSATSSGKQTTVSVGCSSLCLHPWNKKEIPVDRTAENEKFNRISILKVQIASKKRSMLEYLKLGKMLRVTNEELKNEVITSERNSHKAVTQLLEKFEKYSAASKVLTGKHKAEMKQALHEYNKTNHYVTEEMKKMERDENAVNKRLLESETELQILRTYKDKVYPEKALTIAQLQNNIQNLSQDNKEEEQDLDRVIDGERSVFQQSHNRVAQTVVAHAADKAMEYSTLASLDRVSSSNTDLMQEIRQQRAEIKRLEKEIYQLNEDVNSLCSMDKSNMQKFVFPEVFPSRKKCSPDEDIVLNIPVRHNLPI